MHLLPGGPNSPPACFCKLGYTPNYPPPPQNPPIPRTCWPMPSLEEEEEEEEATASQAATKASSPTPTLSRCSQRRVSTCVGVVLCGVMVVCVMLCTMMGQ
jgi:hypothetical protein